MNRLNDQEFATQLASFLNAAQDKVNYYQSRFAHLKDAAPLRVDGGIKWIRIVKPGSGVYVFIDRDTGNVHKAASWKAPVKNNPRSNISDADHGASGVDWHGAVYLR
jgi:hypothetical protein